MGIANQHYRRVVFMAATCLAKHLFLYCVCANGFVINRLVLAAAGVEYFVGAICVFDAVSLRKSGNEKENNMSHFVYNNSSVHYIKEGAGYAVVLLHGFAEDSEVWKYQTSFLKDYFYGDCARFTRQRSIGHTAKK